MRRIVLMVRKINILLSLKPSILFSYLETVLERSFLIHRFRAFCQSLTFSFIAVNASECLLWFFVSLNGSFDVWFVMIYYFGLMIYMFASIKLVDKPSDSLRISGMRGGSTQFRY